MSDLVLELTTLDLGLLDNATDVSTASERAVIDLVMPKRPWVRILGVRVP
jgi:hypothetical protein